MTINVASLQRLNYVECIGLIFKNQDHWQWLQSGSGKPRVARQMPHAKLLKQWNTKDACTIDKLQLAVSEYTSPVSKPSNHPTNQFTTHKIHSLPKWASDELTAWLKKSTSQRTTKYLNFWSYVLHPRCKVDIRTRHISLLLSTQCIQGVHELLHSSMEICNQDLAVNIYDCLRLMECLWLWRDDDQKIHFQFQNIKPRSAEFQYIRNWSQTKTRYYQFVVLRIASWSLKIGHHLPFAALWINLLSKLWRSRSDKWQSKSGSGWIGCWNSKPSWRQATRVNEMDCREGGVQKKKKRR